MPPARRRRASQEDNEGDDSRDGNVVEDSSSDSDAAGDAEPTKSKKKKQRQRKRDESDSEDEDGSQKNKAVMPVVEKSSFGGLTGYTPGAIFKSLKVAVRADENDLFAKKPAVARPNAQPSSSEPAVASTENDTEPNEHDQDPEKLKRTIFVANVPTSWKIEDGAEEKRQSRLKKDLIKHFQTWGAVESVRTRSIPLESVKVPTGSDSKLVRRVAAAKASLDERFPTCNAYIVYKTEESALTALEGADGSLFHGNHLRVDSIRKTGGGKVFDRTRTVYVGNLAFEAGEEELRNHFDRLGVLVESVRIVRDSRTNIGKGFGYVLLAEGKTVDEAIALMHNTEIRARSSFSAFSLHFFTFLVFSNHLAIFAELRVTVCTSSQSQKKSQSKKERARGFDKSKKRPRTENVKKPARKPNRKYGLA